ncbi:MAG: Vi polysaccharide biosynthesis UDP-N-acetylglucosamine C-6 dehydrogenase TviB [Pseudophaeobacter sp. bin_em_oilr2.035]|jgi:UDP-N-acetyl-D-galactosamine dehydrogenase|uniref:Vi polysaccharide biosynthesis UDP-N-acetylglucosamine C-6 dehydrogenase TviB n=1 Tax=Phaeobacter gallaeciensis TaxID=60890 RepID=UPI00237F810C|nr:Vi polysaccharide biosynthesis UDP-N-acetylglucosamine C-6 dehydrogenase TviB [Phaeobacter gallaeciensis]MDE4063461.1 Vi polysaccharide biosynthesis UDP-N-acetylglucosamine C-6 dehydrogenase TviB [Phaeobacter gallaeciensis]MDE4126484.1 Vi polysaccharide biosynthesis UDP-N-acetylglucosamine C-6 dehydrogenase TviB [Phaeobacter gallaeciensis]MDE4130975.1 Vi polysaccharide biosynthesis UDP-N-acetylglucosamine C-6 dehydrogenase TviB [Phaeobacter gallaeciensis]MDF1773384.1 Vi polysaccharide biosyn
MSDPEARICVIGLGYVGLPLAVAFGQQRPTLGFDISADRITELRGGRDRTGEIAAEDLTGAGQLSFTSDPSEIAGCTIFIVTVPTPVDASHRPDLTPLLRASETVGAALKPGDLVIYESTVYPGATEEDCVPVLEAASGLVFNRDFHIGYSPERINPGDKTRRLADIVKVTSGSTPEVAAQVDALYRQVVQAGTHPAPSIRVAEAAKVIENSQRDINIALINELAMIFNRMDIDTEAVLHAAGSKWNFLNFRPGLVGGHCIGVDPYYLTHKAESLGYHPEILLAGRRLNDGMGAYVAGEMVKAMLRRGLPVAGARVLVMGLTFKENCPDLRNTRVIDVLSALEEFGVLPEVHDPHADPEEALREYGIPLVTEPAAGRYDGVMLAVAHDTFRQMGAEAIRAYGTPGALLYDLKYILPPEASDLRL